MCLAIPGQVVEVGEDGLAMVDVAGVRRKVSAGLLGDGLGTGEWVLIHVGFAIAKVNEAEARATYALLAQMGARYEEELAELRESVIE